MKLRVSRTAKGICRARKGQDDRPVSVVKVEFLVGGEQGRQQHHLGQGQAGQQHPEVHLAPEEPELGEAVGGEHGTG